VRTHNQKLRVNLPLFFHIGTGKAGSTYLYGLLQQNPDVSVYPHKEISFYTKNFHKGVQWYQECFPEQGVRIDTSPKYFMQGERAAPRIRKLLAGQRPLFLLILRNPVDNIFAHFKFHKKFKHLDRRRDTYPKSYENVLEHVKTYTSYLERSMYHKILHNFWLTHFSASQFKIICFEDFIDATDDALREILDFFGLSYRRSCPTLRSRNHLLRYRFLYPLKKQIVKRKRIRESFKQSKLFDYLYDRFLTEREAPLTQDERAELGSYFTEDVKRLKEFIDDDLPKWKEFL
jgi:hypothetical protein